ncbi:MAG TPA: hypothetical protein VI997_04830 [Candidatus Thermoplasmatota archaeon]|nr:hypothetical protein [Candidatus Thermoplasmatota archaeon]
MRRAPLVGSVFFALVAANALFGGMIAAPLSGNFDAGAFWLAASAALSGAVAAWLLYEKARSGRPAS